MKWLENNPKLVILLVGISIFLFNLDVIPVTIMEARNFITAREMVTDGRWLLTTMNELPRYEKPPLPSWITAIFGFIFGLDNIVGLRLPTMLMAIALGYIAYLFSLNLLKNKKQALINALILLSSFYVIAITIEAPWDIYTHGFMLAAIYFLYDFFGQHSLQWKNALLAAFFIGLSFMSKGPISFYGLLLPFLLAYAFVYKFKGFKIRNNYLHLMALVTVAAMVGLWWFVYVRLADPHAFLAIAEKETANWTSYNVRPFYYYWSFFVQSGLWTIPAFVGLLYPYLKNKVSHKKVYQLTFLWTVFSLVLLSIIPEKKARYLVPVLIPLALNTGFYIDYLIRSFKNRLTAREKIPVYFHFGLIGVLGLVFPFVAYFFLHDNLGDFWIFYVLSSTALFAIGILIFIQLKNKDLFKAFLYTITFIAVIKVFALPIAGALQKNPAYHNISDLRSTIATEDMEIYVYGEIAPELLWEYGSAIPLLNNEEQLTIPDTGQFYVLVSPVDESDFKRIFDTTFSYELKTVYDFNNNASPGAKGHKNRLVSNLYLVKKQ
ncbi:ArnT family glycosyltransferase [Arenibacter sp. 6A1]|uniref:ArnT family glycosyltransferase n=1 Tax=Arenibacter sp. 6A1 TaxID=2720391 RepID=UPI001F0F93DC|nr:glycosyltransferase family 39 protein [Arenibacter sp. 6A1]